jgi:signal transduction histidine kinase
MDADAMLPQLEEIELSRWLQGYWPRWASDKRNKDMSLVNSIDSSIHVRVSPTLVARVLDNLISNALKYSQPDTTVRLVAEDLGSEVSISVVDAGRGIAASDIASIFDPFFRTKDAREAGIAGHGLGLAIASRIATAMRARLECRSQLGSGSSFTLFLPKS